MTKIISAFPCLGKTTMTHRCKTKFFDAEIYESRATKGMTDDQIDKFFANAAANIKLIYDTNYYEYIFITDDNRLLDKLRAIGLTIIHILPDTTDQKAMAEYKERVIRRSGKDWFENILSEDLIDLPSKIKQLQASHEDVRLTHFDEYIEDVIPEIAHSLGYN